MKKYDIFISCKSEDYAKAEPVYHWLVEQGYTPFFSPISLRMDPSVSGEPVVFGEEIDEALDRSDNMIVIASKAEYVKTGYVKDEWRTFVEEQRAGRKQGNLVTILEGVEVPSLPIRLRSVQSFTLDAYRNGLLRYMWSRGEQKDVGEQEHVQPKNQEKIIPIKAGDVEFNMVYVEGGTFTMGATAEQGSDAWDGEKPAHKVTLSDYYIGETQVTQALWKAVMKKEPSYNGGWTNEYGKGMNNPAYRVSYKEIVEEFLPTLNRMTGRTFRLPTEAEWEYAARGGNKSKGWKYSGSDKIDDVAWYDGNSGGKTHPVKGKMKNELGLYDMSGNVWEWCNDWYGGYSSGVQTNPKGPDKGSSRVLRGGSWNINARDCRVSYRSTDAPDDRSSLIGFRLVLCP